MWMLVGVSIHLMYHHPCRGVNSTHHMVAVVAHRRVRSARARCAVARVRAAPYEAAAAAEQLSGSRPCQDAAQAVWITALACRMPSPCCASEFFRGMYVAASGALLQ
jgi:hypothetical protein